MTLLTIKNLTLKRHGAPLLEFPDFVTERGQKTLLLGPSGSGKTTLLSMIAGLLKPSSGQILIDEENFYEMSSSARDFVRGKKFGFVFQTLHLLPSLTLRQNIALAADNQRVNSYSVRLRFFYALSPPWDTFGTLKLKNRQK